MSDGATMAEMPAPEPVAEIVPSPILAAAASLLPTLPGPGALRDLDEAQLRQLCREIRTTIIETVATTGGHLGSSLGAVELAVALHRLLDSPRDRIVWDTGHQAYAHKLLTGRYDRFGTLRQLGGVGGFPRRGESEHDVFDGGHAGTGLSIAQGLATARDLRGEDHRIAVVVGDAALISGVALEALNDIGQATTSSTSPRLANSRRSPTSWCTASCPTWRSSPRTRGSCRACAAFRWRCRMSSNRFRRARTRWT